MGDPLIPTRILNKNGVATTVHKKQAKSTGKQKDVPAPVMLDEAITTGISTRIGSVFGVGGLRDSNGPKIERRVIEERLRKLPARTRQSIITMFDEHHGEIYPERMVVSMLYRDLSPATIEDVIHVYDKTNDWAMLVINSAWDEYGYDVDYGITSKFDWVRRYNSTLSGFSFRPEEGDSTPLLHHDEKTQAQVIALIDITGFLAESGEFPFEDPLVTTSDEELLLRDTTLAQLIVDHADRYHEVMAIATGRRTLNAGLLRSMLEADSQPLRDGTL